MLIHHLLTLWLSDYFAFIKSSNLLAYSSNAKKSIIKVLASSKALLMNITLWKESYYKSTKVEAKKEQVNQHVKGRIHSHHNNMILEASLVA